jgi:hypothetical protein
MESPVNLRVCIHHDAQALGVEEARGVGIGLSLRQWYRSKVLN